MKIENKHFEIRAVAFFRCFLEFIVIDFSRLHIHHSAFFFQSLDVSTFHKM